MNNEDNIVNYKDISSPNAPTYLTENGKLDTESKSLSLPVLFPSRPVPIVEEVQENISAEDGAKPQVVVSEQPLREHRCK
jgi:hypothetical protein